MTDHTITTEQMQQFLTQGFVIVDQLLSPEETELLREVARADQVMLKEAASRADGEGGAVKLSVQNELPVNSIYGAIIRSEKLVRPMEQLLGGEVYHYHHKMIFKEPRVGGAWAWHQDYGYWYNNGCLYPLMASCMMAVDGATKENGCLQVLAGSHLLGRIDHGRVGEQTGADQERVAEARKRLELVHCELQPGSAVFFHCNLLHRSDQNRSDHPRWAFIGCYNAARNDPYKESRHPRYSPLEVWPHDKVLEVGQAHWNRLQQTQE